MLATHLKAAMTCVLLGALLFASMPTSAHAQVPDAAMQAKIQMLLKMIEQLQKKVTELKNSQTNSTNPACSITTDKKVYRYGDTVKLNWDASNTGNLQMLWLKNDFTSKVDKIGLSGAFNYEATLGSGEYKFSIYRDIYEAPLCEVLFVIAQESQLQNLSIASISLSRPNGIGHTSIPGYPVPDQKVKVVLKNNKFGNSQSNLQTLRYIATLYEYDSAGRRVKTGAFSAGEAVVPAGAYGSSEFEFNIEGGLPFDGENLEKKYQIRLEIDVTNAVKESNENDNRIWSKTWITSFYKG